MMKRMENELRAVMLGHAIADALGVPVEFQPRESLKQKPVVDYVGYGTHHMPAGTWSDDTSMALASLDSLCHGVDFDHMMQCFSNWQKNAAYTATGEMFDIGITTADSLYKYRKGTAPLLCGGSGERDNGNGALMRIHPAVFYCRYRMTDCSLDERMVLIHSISALTHRHPRSKLGCGIYSFVLNRLLDKPEKASVAAGLQDAYEYYGARPDFVDELSKYDRVFSPTFAQLPEDDIISGGYVVTTLEAAIWCLLTTDNYADCVLKAVNLGRDTDTVGAVAGGLAGALYGLEGIPQKWIDGLLKKELLLELCENFMSSVKLSVTY